MARFLPFPLIPNAIRSFTGEPSDCTVQTPKVATYVCLKKPCFFVVVVGGGGGVCGGGTPFTLTPSG